MRNLKRVLSLALALVMVLGMMVITTSAADFTDADEITETEAVEVMAALGILVGDNGKFNPTGKLNRAGAAKLIAFMTMGAEADEYLAGSTAPFDDVAADHWAAKYITYCSNLKVINGNGDGTFNPDGNISTVGFAKLVLGAAGIKGEYTGANWENNVKDAVAATPAMKATGIKITTADITREEAAALMLAGMKSGGTTTKYYYVVDYAVTDVDEATSTQIHGKFTSPTDAYVLANIMNGTPNTVKVLSDTETTGTLLKNVYGVTYKTADADAFGNPGVGYEKTVGGKKVIDLFYAEDATLTYTADMNTVAGLKAIVADLEALDIEFTEDFGNNNYRFSTGKFATVDGKANDTACNSTLALAQLTGDNTIVKVYIEDEAVTLITVENTYADKVATVVPYNAQTEADAYITLTSASDLTTIKTDKFAQNDVVLYTKAWNATANKYDVVAMEKAATVTGTLTSYTSAGKYTIDGKVYELSSAVGAVESATSAIGKLQVYALDQNGDIVAVNDPAGAAPVVLKDYAVVIDAAATYKTTASQWAGEADVVTIAAQIKVLLADGTVEIWDVPVLKATKAIAGTSIIANDYYYMLGKTPVELTITGGDDAAKATSIANALKGLTSVYTYADKALVAEVTALTGSETKSAVALAANSGAITKTSYVNNNIILNDQTVFILKTVDGSGNFKGYVVKTGLAALEDTSISSAQIIADVIVGKDAAGNTTRVNVATLVFADETAFDGSDATQTQDYVYVDGDYTYSMNGEKDVYTYNVVYADGTKGTISTATEALDTGVYKLKSDGSCDTSTANATKLTVKIVSGTTVIIAGDPSDVAMTTNAKTVVVPVVAGGTLKAGAEMYVVQTSNVIALAFIVK